MDRDKSREPLVWRPQQVADALGTSVAAVRRLIRDGLLPARRLGRRVIVLPEELKAWLVAAPRTQEKVQEVVGEQFDFIARDFVPLPEHSDGGQQR